jgi:hypothetical protein
MDQPGYMDMDVETMRVTPCPVSSVYDSVHYERYEAKCRFKHHLFHWEGVGSNQVTLISDSICKWVNDIPHLEIQAIPGLSLTTVVENITNGTLKIDGFHGIIFHVATNDVTRNSPETIGDLMSDLVTYLRQATPLTRLGVSMILPRPKDSDEMDSKRRQANSVLKKLCKVRGLTYFRSYKGVRITNQVYNKKLYAHDKLHLKMAGIQ